MNSNTIDSNIDKFCYGTRANECVTVFNPAEQSFQFEYNLKDVLSIDLNQLNHSCFAKPFSMIEEEDPLISETDRELMRVLLIAIYSTFFEFRSSFRSLKDYLYCSFRMHTGKGEMVRIEKETHTLANKDGTLLLVDMWRRVDFKAPHKRIEWGPSVLPEEKEVIVNTIKTHIYRNLGITPLSKREEQIIKLISTGLSLQTVGEQLFIERNTVKKHLENIKRKLSGKFDKSVISSKDQMSNVVRELGILDI
ncbi:MAG: LuxR C-terminal-related transcriptional regulator [Bacteroidota bacterium]